MQYSNSLMQRIWFKHFLCATDGIPFVLNLNTCCGGECVIVLAGSVDHFQNKSLVSTPSNMVGKRLSFLSVCIFHLHLAILFMSDIPQARLTSPNLRAPQTLWRKLPVWVPKILSERFIVLQKGLKCSLIQPVYSAFIFLLMCQVYQAYADFLAERPDLGDSWKLADELYTKGFRVLFILIEYRCGCCNSLQARE